MDQTAAALSVLRGAAEELWFYGSQHGSQNSTPRAGGGGAPPAATAATAATPSAATAAAPPSAAHTLLQISALHKAFLALSEAFLEEMGQRQEERDVARQALAAVRRECAGTQQTAAALQEDVLQLAAGDGQQAHAHVLLAQRCSQLEEEVARLRLQLEDRQSEADEAVQRQVEAAAARLEGGAATAARQAVQQWAADALPALLQPMQDAVGATAELASSVALESGRLAAALQQLEGRCDQLHLILGDHDERLGAVERCGGGGGGGGTVSAQLEQLGRQVHALQAGHSYLDETLLGVRQQQQQQQQAASTPGRLASADAEALSQAAAELPAVQQQLASVAEQQAQHARTTEGLVQSVLADVRALARHTKALDREMRALRRESAQTQAAVLQSAGVFSAALSVPSPVGPFTSFPPQI